MSAPKKIWVKDRHMRDGREWMEARASEYTNIQGTLISTPYILLSEHERVKAQRDELLAAVGWAASLYAERESIATVDPDMPRGYGLCQIEQDCYAKMKGAIAACEGDE